MSDPWAPGPSAQWACVGLGGRAGSALKRAYDLLLPSPTAAIVPAPATDGSSRQGRGEGKARTREKLAGWLAGESAPRLYYGLV